MDDFLVRFIIVGIFLIVFILWLMIWKENEDRKFQKVQQSLKNITMSIKTQKLIENKSQDLDAMQQIINVILLFGDAANKAIKTNNFDCTKEVCEGLIQLSGEIARQMGKKESQPNLLKLGGRLVRRK